jgi:hypothetical protein
MPYTSDLTLSDNATLGLFYIQRYRFLTIDQFARATALNRSTASDQLRMMERHEPATGPERKKATSVVA